MQGVPDPGGAAAAIEFRAATKRYPGRDAPAVRELSLSVPAGEICVLIGPSGSGKTTAMKMVNRLIDITEGDITIGGQSVRSLDLTELRRGIGYVIQQIGLFPHMSVEDNIGDGAAGCSAGTSSASATAWASCSSSSGSTRATPGVTRGSSPAASASASAWPAPWPPTSRSCSWTSPSARSTRSPATGCRTSSCACTPRSARRSSSSRTTSTRRSRWARGWRSCKDGELVQYGTPDDILARPVDGFVADFVGADRGLKRLRLRALRDIELTSTNGGADELPTIDERTSLRDALSLMVTRRVTALAVLGEGGERRGTVSMESLAHFADLDESGAGVEA